MMLIGLCVVVVVSAASADDLWRTRNVDKAAREANSGLIQMMRSNIATTTNNHVSVVDGSLNDATSERPTVEGVVVAEQCVNGTYAAVATNCSTFVACNGSNRTEGYCPPGMWFDPNHEADMLCNYPEVVCAADNTVCQCATEYPPLAADPLIEADVTCLKDNRFHLNGSRVDCGRYFVCFNGHVQRMECKQGFHYDPKAQRCDYPEIVNCKIIDPACPSHGVGFLPHLERKDAFYFCFHGYKTLQSCAFYHVWDASSNSCRRRDEMNMV